MFVGLRRRRPSRSCASTASGSAWPSSSPTTSSTSRSEADEPGKTPGTDLREGKRTLPVLYALASTDPADARLRELLQADLRDEALLDEALGLLRAHPAMEQAREHTSAVATAAQDVLDPLPDGEAKAALRALATSVVTRVG